MVIDHHEPSVYPRRSNQVVVDQMHALEHRKLLQEALVGALVGALSPPPQMFSGQAINHPVYAGIRKTSWFIIY